MSRCLFCRAYFLALLPLCFARASAMRSLCLAVSLSVYGCLWSALILALGPKSAAERSRAQQEQLRRIQPLGTLAAPIRVTPHLPDLRAHLPPHTTDNDVQSEHVAHPRQSQFSRGGAAWSALKERLAHVRAMLCNAVRQNKRAKEAKKRLKVRLPNRKPS